MFRALLAEKLSKFIFNDKKPQNKDKIAIISDREFFILNVTKTLLHLQFPTPSLKGNRLAGVVSLFHFSSDDIMTP